MDKEKKECCESGSEGGCGCGCGSSCNTGKAIIALILLLVGGAIGYLMGGHCSMKKMCGPKGMGMMADCPMSAPQAPEVKK